MLWIGAASGSAKWDKVGGKIYGNPDATPMFIADMDFSIPETVQQAIKDRVTEALLPHGSGRSLLRSAGTVAGRTSQLQLSTRRGYA